MTAVTRTATVVRYRIETRKPGETRWQFVPFSGAGPVREGPTALPGLRVRIAGARQESPGWSFRITKSTTTTKTTITGWSAAS